VFIFMNLHSLQRQFSTGTGTNRLPGHSLRRRWIMPASVAMRIAGRAAPAKVNHLFRGANLVGQQADGLGAFGMGDQRGVGELAADARDSGVGELDVRVTTALPQGHLPARLLHHPGAEVLVRDEQQVALFGGGVDDFDGVAAGANDIAQGL
jgi:hypothetical protein